MSIDEAIAHAREVAEKNRKDYEWYSKNPKVWNDGGKKQRECISCAEEHEQLAEWLEKLQYIENIILKWNADWYNDEDNGIPDNEILEAIFNACNNNGFDIPIDEDYIKGKKDGYNKAINDFAKELCKSFDETTLNDDGYYPNNVVRSIAEQLKEGWGA